MARIALDLRQYARAFAQTRIGPLVRRALTDQDLQECGTTALGAELDVCDGDREKALAGVRVCRRLHPAGGDR